MEAIALKKLLDRMTLREKLAQLSQVSLSFYREDLPKNFTGPLSGREIPEELLSCAGSIIGDVDAQAMNRLMLEYMAKSPNGIPPLIMLDVIHGYRTIFPIPLAMACSWSEALVEKACRISAEEAAAAGVHVTFAPMGDLVRDPRWGRAMESFGEDPLLNGKFCAASVRGFQGQDLKSDDTLASCVKHFAGYGAPEGGREYNTVDISRGMLREFYLSGYRAAIREGCELVMPAFNTLERVPCTCNEWLLAELLRGELGFDKVVISDWNAIDELIAHGAAQDGAEAAQKALDCGVDMDMMSGHYLFHLEEAVEKTPALQQKIDAAVERILRLKDKLGLFENPFRGIDPQKEKELLLCPGFRAVAREAAEQSMVLLKNEGELLPLENAGQELALLGSLAHSSRYLGHWRAHGRDEETVTLEQGLLACGYRPVLLPQDTAETEKETARVKLAAHSGIAIVLSGEDEDDCGEGGSRTSLRLPQEDRALLARLAGEGVRVVLVVFSGRPLVLTEEAKQCAAVVQAWFPGTEGGSALANLLTGKSQPSGRLAMSFPRGEGQIPVYYNCLNTGRPYLDKTDTSRYFSRYIDEENEPLYPFGYGLGYTRFSYGGLKLSDAKLCGGETLNAQITVKNCGNRPGVETVQLYLRDIAASVSRPVAELKDFCRVALQPGEEKTVSFAISQPMLAFWNNEDRFAAEDGEFLVMVGANSREYAEARFHFTNSERSGQQ